MTIENIRSLLETKTSEEIAKEFSDNLNKAIQMKEEEAKVKEENGRVSIRLEILEDIMGLIGDYLYLSDYKYPNEEKVDLREVDKLIQDFLAMTETVGSGICSRSRRTAAGCECARASQNRCQSK